MAVNPGLAAIWEEEKKRLNKDKLDDSSYRPTPPLAMSEVLLKEKLLENLKLPVRKKPYCLKIFDLYIFISYKI